MKTQEFKIEKGFSEQKQEAEEVILTGMEMHIEFDRPYNNEEHYISPGGYELNGKQFDFFTTYGYTAEAGNIVEIEVEDPDLDAFPVPVTKQDVIEANKNGKFDEFFIYTGESDEPEINPVSIKQLTFHFSDGIALNASESLKESINEYFAELTKEEDMER